MQMAQQAFGGMGGGMPGMGGGMPGQSPFSAEALEKLKTNPKIAKHLQDTQFKNLYDMCIAQPNMLMQLMQMDPRFMDVIQELTGIDLGALGKQQQQQEEQTEAMRQKAEEDRKKRQAEEEARKKAEAEAALPQEEKEKLNKAREAEAIKNKGNEFYKKRDFENALKYYFDAIVMNPNEILFYSNVASCFIEQKKYSEAIEQCNKGIELTKGTNYDYVKLAKVMARKASALEKSGQIDEALKVYAAALLENNDSTIKDAMKRLEKVRKE